jgi:hypothetical protein
MQKCDTFLFRMFGERKKVILLPFPVKFASEYAIRKVHVNMEGSETK